MDLAVTWEGKVAGKEAAASVPLPSGVLFLPNGPLEGGCPGEALGQQLIAAPGLRACPSAPPRR